MTTDIQSALERAARTLSSGRLTNETQISHAVIMPILRALGWDQANPAELSTEYNISKNRDGKGRVDFALLRTDGHPLVFIEAKRPNNLNAAGVNQLFDYATNKGVPLLILTDGAEWRFFLSMAAGLPDERRFYRAELRGGVNIPEIARHFDSYLHKNRVHSGDAQRAAEKFYQSSQSKAEAKNSIPKIWRSLLQEPDDALRNLLVEAVEEKCGTRPELDDVSEFLDKQSQDFGKPQTPNTKTRTRSRADQSPPKEPILVSKNNKKAIIGFILDGEKFTFKVANQVLAGVIVTLHQRYPNFMEEYAFSTQGRTRRLVAKNRNDLYDLKHLIDYSIDLKNGWWLGSNISSGDVRKNIRKACDTAGIKFGKDLRLIESN